MSRVIKFRAWDGIRMIMPSDNSYYQHYVSFCGGIIQKSSEGMSCFGGGDNWRVIDGLVLMQFTGLHDVNGVEIWQGDIVRLWNGNKTFVGHDGFQFTTTKRLKPVSRQMLSDCSVIGNIYQHPELLEPKP